MDDLIERLRGEDYTCPESMGCGTMKFCACATMDDAARIAALEADNARLMGLVKEAGEGFSGPTAWLERWATHVGNCHGGALCECGLTLASLESATTLAKIKETPDAE